MKTRNNLVHWCLLVLFFSSAAMAQTYSVADLGVLPGESASWGTFINSSGQVTGCSDTSSVQSDLCNFVDPGDAFLWSSSNGMQDLGTLPGDDLSIGFYISDTGEIVGSSWNTQTQTGHGFVWTQSSGMVDLGTLIGSSGYSDADAITTNGVIVGESSTSNGGVDAVIWTKSGSGYQIRDVGHLPGAPYTYPYDINNNEQIVGVAYPSSGPTYHGFLWSKAAGWKDLGTLPGGKLSAAYWINSSGIVAGQSTSAKYPNGVAVLWDQSANIHTLGTLPGGTTSYSGYISDSEVALGQSTVSGGDLHAFIWTKKTGLQDLNTMIPPNSGWDLNHAGGMNKAGQIVGFGTINGTTHGFLLTP